jgi:peroxiredoxin
MELEALEKISGQIDRLGGTLVAIAPQPRETNLALKTEKKLGFDILSDPGNKVAQSYGIRYRLPDDLSALYLKFDINLPEFNGDDSWTLPLPARYIIDQASTVCYAKINADYTVRPEPEETLAALNLVN